MRSNQHGYRRTSSFGRSMTLYALFLLTLALVALLSMMAGDPVTPVASFSQAHAQAAAPAGVEPARADPSLPSAGEALGDSTERQPAEAVTPTF
jgi:hypothetical protein